MLIGEWESETRKGRQRIKGVSVAAVATGLIPTGKH